MGSLGSNSVAFSKFGIVLVYGRAETSDGIMIAPVQLSFNTFEYTMGSKVHKIVTSSAKKIMLTE